MRTKGSGAPTQNNQTCPQINDPAFRTLVGNLALAVLAAGAGQRRRPWRWRRRPRRRPSSPWDRTPPARPVRRSGPTAIPWCMATPNAPMTSIAAGAIGGTRLSSIRRSFSERLECEPRDVPEQQAADLGRRRRGKSCRRALRRRRQFGRLCNRKRPSRRAHDRRARRMGRGRKRSAARRGPSDTAVRVLMGLVRPGAVHAGSGDTALLASVSSALGGSVVGSSPEDFQTLVIAGHEANTLWLFSRAEAYVSQGIAVPRTFWPDDKFGDGVVKLDLAVNLCNQRRFPEARQLLAAARARRFLGLSARESRSL